MRPRELIVRFGGTPLGGARPGGALFGDGVAGAPLAARAQHKASGASKRPRAASTVAIAFGAVILLGGAEGAAQDSSAKDSPVRELQTEDMPLDAFGYPGGLIEARFHEPHATTDDPREEIRQAAFLYGLDVDMMMSVAKVESNFNPRARTGSYKGLFQLSDYEFEKYGDGSIWDARDNARAAARMFLIQAEKLKGALGRYPGHAERYMVHQQGIQGAIEHYTHPARAAWQSMCETDEGVLKGERWCKKCIWQNLLPQWKRTFKSVEKISSGDFVGLWTGRINDLANRFSVAEGGVSTSPPAKSPASRQVKRPTPPHRASDRVAHRAR